MWMRFGFFILFIIIVAIFARRNKIWSAITVIAGLIIAIYIGLIVGGGIYHWQKKNEIVSSQKTVILPITDVLKKFKKLMKKLRLLIIKFNN